MLVSTETISGSMWEKRPKQLKQAKNGKPIDGLTLLLPAYAFPTLPKPLVPQLA
jgi:hypothetical protein